MERKFPVTLERCGSQWGCQRCSSRPGLHWWCLQWQKEYSLTNISRFLIRPWAIFFFGKGTQTKYLIAKRFFSRVGMGKPRWFTKLCVCVSACALSLVWFIATPWIVALQASLSMGFPRQEYWSGLPFANPGNLPTQGWNPCLVFCIGRQILYHCTTWKAFTK